MRRVVLVVSFIAALVAVPRTGEALLPPLLSGLLGGTVTTVRVDPNGDLGPVNTDLVGFNWRVGGEAIAPTRPGVVRMWSVDFSRITTAPGVYDWSVPDTEIDAIRAMGATPMIVLIGRPSWSPLPGSAGYEEAVRAAVQRYGVDRVPAGAEPAWFESGNEPEFPPTSHGQFLTDLPLDAAAQARAVAAVEAANPAPGGHAGAATQRWGGPGALFPDPAAVEVFVLGAALGGRNPDYLSWHAYTNQPLFGPDGSERDDPLSQLAYSLLRGTNPLASPLLIGAGVEVMKVLAALVTAPDGDPPDLVLSEWHLSSGGLDRRHDTHEGAAHTLAGLVELQTHGAAAATFFASVDRHCPQVPGPDPRCGDFGIATADGDPKPAWWAFDWWHRLAGTDGGARVVPLAGPSPLEGFWGLASRDVDGTVRVLLTSFSALAPSARTVRLAGLGPVGAGATVRYLDDPSGVEPAAEPLGADLVVRLPANSAALVELPPG